MPRILFYSCLGCLLFVSGSAITHAQQDCGTITNNFSGETEVVPIADCTNPFEVTAQPTVTPVFTTSGKMLTNNEQLFVSSTTVSVPVTVSFASPGVTQVFGSLYAHDGDDYVQVGETDVSLSNVRNLTVLVQATGTYTFAADAFFADGPGAPQVSQAGLWQRIKSQVVPVAHAQIIGLPTNFGFQKFAITFTIEQDIPEPEPVGASSVMFLPGIQASRLYKDGLLGTEDQLWEPQGNGDVRQLAMTEEGESVEDVYTRDVIEEITGSFFGANIYKGFLGLLDDLQTDEIITAYEPFAYDWRYSVFAAATQPVAYPDGEERVLLDEVLKLAESSHTGKVTIVAHSNGGLVAKALLHEYGDNELAGKVDKLVMIGTPQLGTPQAVGAMLHGLGQQKIGGLVIDDGVARETIRNMPGVYTLLPSERYFSEVVTDPLVTNDGTVVTAGIRTYGDITNISSLDRLLTDSDDVLVNTPGINELFELNSTLLGQARAEQIILDTWQAPAGVEVYEVVGTGLLTISSFEYREFVCSPLVAGASCLLNTFPKPYPQFSNQGDETVIAGSAEAYQGDKVTARIDLREEGEEGLILERGHADLTESPAVQAFVDSVIKYPYVQDTIQVPDFAEVSSQYTIVSAHSPVTLRVTDSDGNIAGVDGDTVREDIIGSQYLTFASSSYIIVPQDIDAYTIEVNGTADGVYTLFVDELSADNEQTPVVQIAASSTDSMQATLSVTDGEYSNLTSDLDGDGEVDEVRTLNGELVSEPEPPQAYTYADLQVTIDTIDNRYTRRYLSHWTQKAQWFAQRAEQKPRFARLEKRTLTFLNRSVRWFERKGRLDTETTAELQDVISFLQDN